MEGDGLGQVVARSAVHRAGVSLTLAETQKIIPQRLGSGTLRWLVHPNCPLTEATRKISQFQALSIATNVSGLGSVREGVLS